MGFKTGILLITLLVGSLALPAPESESDFFFHTDPSARIVGGSVAPVGSVPYMVAMTSGFLLRSLMCGGSLITQRTVLTAAHCIDAVYGGGQLISSLRVIVGTNRWNSGGQIYTLARNVTHQHYVSNLIKNDIGLLTTTTEVVLSDDVKPVPLSFDFIGQGVEVRAAGWGRIRQGGSISAQLLELIMETTDGQMCVRNVAEIAAANNMRPPAVDPHLELCAFHSTGRGMCNGDSGSALVLVDGKQQVGVVSWGIPCGRGAPDMFVRVSSYRSWLLQHAV